MPNQGGGEGVGGGGSCSKAQDVKALLGGKTTEGVLWFHNVPLRENSFT